LGAIYTRRLKRKHRGFGDTFFIDEVFVKINGKQHYLWRAVDQDGEVVDVFHNLFNLGRHLVSASHYKNLRSSAFGEWSGAVA